MALGDLIVHLMVDETLFLLVLRAESDLTIGVGGVKGFTERGWTWGEKMFSRDIVN